LQTLPVASIRSLRFHPFRFCGADDFTLVSIGFSYAASVYRRVCSVTLRYFVAHGNHVAQNGRENPKRKPGFPRRTRPILGDRE
jgi:hypothetical protein